MEWTLDLMDLCLINKPFRPGYNFLHHNGSSKNISSDLMVTPNSWRREDSYPWFHKSFIDFRQQAYATPNKNQNSFEDTYSGMFWRYDFYI